MCDPWPLGPAAEIGPILARSGCRSARHESHERAGLSRLRARHGGEPPGHAVLLFFTVRDVFECQQDEVTTQRAATNWPSVQQEDCVIEISRVMFDDKIFERVILGKNFLQQPAQLGNIPLLLIELGRRNAAREVERSN